MKQGTRNVTIREVAQKAGVSHSTVSRILNGVTEGFSVKPKVRERIEKAVKSLGYRPHIHARTLKTGKTKLVAIGNTVAWPLYPGVNQVMFHHFVAEMIRLGYEVCTAFNVAGSIPSWQVSGIALPRHPDPLLREELARKKIPCVSLNTYAPNVRVETESVLTFDGAGGMRLALEHLASLGHRRIAYLNLRNERPYRSPFGGPPELAEDGESSGEWNTRIRQEAFVRGVDKLGLPLLKGYDRRDLDLSAWFDLALSQKASALVAWEHYDAVEILREAGKRGLRIPEDLSLVCFNQFYPGNFTRPAITCVSFPGEEMGLAAARTLADMMEKGAPSLHQTFSGELLLRESTAPFKK